VPCALHRLSIAEILYLLYYIILINIYIQRGVECAIQFYDVQNEKVNNCLVRRRAATERQHEHWRKDPPDRTGHEQKQEPRAGQAKSRPEASDGGPGPAPGPEVAPPARLPGSPQTLRLRRPSGDGHTRTRTVHKGRFDRYATYRQVGGGNGTWYVDACYLHSILTLPVSRSLLPAPCSLDSRWLGRRRDTDKAEEDVRNEDRHARQMRSATRHAARI
jgi:hypothetical protein